MKVFGYHYGLNGVSHYRVLQPLKYLEGMEVGRLPDRSDRLSLPMEGDSNLPGIQSHQQITDDHDLIFTTHVSGFEGRGRIVAQSLLKPVVVDLDDDVWAVDKSNTRYGEWTYKWREKEQMYEIPDGELDKHLEKAAKVGAQVLKHNGKDYFVHTGFDPKENITEELRNAAGVTVSTERLKKIVQRVNPNVTVIPNSYDPDLFSPMSEPNDGKVRLGMFGANGHYHDWKMIMPVVMRVLEENPHVKLVVNTNKIITKEDQGVEMTKAEGVEGIFDFLEEVPEKQLEVMPIAEMNDWHERIRSSGVDIALCPLVDTQFNRAKSNLKYIEWGGFGVPGVYSKTETFKDTVIQGKSGFLCSDLEHWYKRITQLVKDKSLRKLMGAHAKRDVSENYHQKDASVKLAQFFKKTRENYENANRNRLSA